MQMVTREKANGAYYTPDAVVRSLVSWAVRSSEDRMLDPSCGDGRFLVVHSNSVGVEQDPAAAAVVHNRAPGSLLHEGDFFSWAGRTQERFECAAGNPPFIRYQRFTGAIRAAAHRVCSRHGAHFSSLASSWAPFLVATASLLKPGGRMAFVVPAEIAHVPYARPLLEYLMSRFRRVQVVAVRHKLFPELSENCWLLYADGYGSTTDSILLSQVDSFRYMTRPPLVREATRVGRESLERWRWRLRPFLMPTGALEAYEEIASRCDHLADVARVGIGYVTGANEFFHLRPSEAAIWAIPDRFLVPSVRNGRSLSAGRLTAATVERWEATDEPFLLLRLKRGAAADRRVRKYLDSDAGLHARQAYKCRTREPWYVVPDVTVPDAFVSYMTTDGPLLVENSAGCVGTNSVHVVRLNGKMTRAELRRLWKSPLTAASAEIEGHPLGGGMLKIEPREAGRILLCHGLDWSQLHEAVQNGAEVLRRWRRCAA